MSDVQKRPWNVAVGSFICWTLMVGYGRCFGIFYTVIMERYQTNSAEAALIFSIQNVVRVIAAPLVLPLMRRFGIQLVTMTAGILYAVGVMASVAYPSLITLYVGVGGISGLGASALFVAPLLAINRSFMGDSMHATAMGFATAGCGVGTLLFGPVNEALLATYGFNGAMIITGAILLHFCVGGALLGDPHNKLDKVKTSEETCLITENAQSQHTLLDVQKSESKQQNGHALADGTSDSLTYTYRIKRQIKKCYSAALEICSVQFVLYEVSMFFALIVIFANFLFIDKLGEELSIPHSGIAVILVVIGVCDMAGRISYGYIFDIKLGRNRKHFFLAISGLFTGLATASVGLAQTYQHLLWVCGLYGVMMGGYGGQTYTVIPDLVPGHYVPVVTLMTVTIQAIGTVVGPVVQGVVVDYFQTYTVAYTGSGVILSVLSLITMIHFCCKEFWFSGRTHQKYENIDNS